MFRLPKSVRFALTWGVAFLIILALCRLAFWWYFRADDTNHEPLSVVLRAFLYGSRFDLRLTLLILVPFLILGSISWFSPFRSVFMRAFWVCYFSLAGFISALLVVFDFGHFAYLRVHLNASILSLAENTHDSAVMVWETYPVIPVLIGITLFTWLLARFTRRRLLVLLPLPVVRNGKLKGSLFGFILFWLVAFGIHGQLSQYPLRWSNAFFTPNPFISNLGLNPVLNLFDTMDYEASGYDLKKVQAAYPRMVQYLQVDHPNAQTLTLRRVVEPRAGALNGTPNVVLVLVESFSGYKTSLFGNPLNTTPYFDTLAQHGMLFTRYFTPHFGTAHGVFATLTGIPDVERSNTSSRNPLAADQHIIMNSDFPNYAKYYFIGGSTSWANIRGILTSNIKGIDIHEEGSFTSPHNDAWGISDTNLFKEANKIFRQQQKPFFAIIQTSGNHRPYTIPADSPDFQVLQVDPATLKANGFDSNAEYNSFRYMDYSIRSFIETAKHEPYFDNTIFIFTGDHGITGNAGKILPSAWTDLHLSTVHTPFLIYAPKLVPTGISNKIASQVDIMPTIAGLMNRPYTNTTFGRDLLNPRYDADRRAFVINHERGPEIGSISPQYDFVMQIDGSRPHLAYLEHGDATVDVSAQYPDVAKQMEQFTWDYYETARYLLLNNKKAGTQ